MQFLDYNENKQRGTFDFPFELYHVDQNHPQYIMSYHWHIEYEIIRIIQGELKITLDEKEFLAQKGDILFIHSGTLHSGIPFACVYECIVFDLNTFLKLQSSCKKFFQNIIDQSILVFHHFSANHHEIHQCIWNIFDAMKRKPSGYELLVYGEFYHFFGLVYEHHFYLDEAVKTRKDYKRIFQLKKVLELIENSYSTDITLQDLSTAANMSPKYFCRFFYEMTHKTPIDYLNYHRIEHACNQLLTTDENVTEIALNCGFNNLSYFIKTFKKYKGTTPKKYKG